jgi:hypothetical protein
MEQARFGGSFMASLQPMRLIAAAFVSLLPLSFQVFNSPVDGGDQFMVPLALGPSLFRSQHVGELGQQVAFCLPNEHHSMRASAQVTVHGATTSMIMAVSTRPNRQNRSIRSRMSVLLVQKQKLRAVHR